MKERLERIHADYLDLLLANVFTDLACLIFICFLANVTCSIPPSLTHLA